MGEARLYFGSDEDCFLDKSNAKGASINGRKVKLLVIPSNKTEADNDVCEKSNTGKEINYKSESEFDKSIPGIIVDKYKPSVCQNDIRLMFPKAKCIKFPVESNLKCGYVFCYIDLVCCLHGKKQFLYRIKNLLFSLNSIYIGWEM